MKISIEYFVYAIFVEAPTETLVKIGRTSNVRARVSGVRTGCPYPIVRTWSMDVETDQAGIEIESDAHTQFARKRLEGEWFSPWGARVLPLQAQRLEADLIDVATDVLGHPPRRTFEHSPVPFSHRKVQMAGAQLSGESHPKHIVIDNDGFSVAGGWRAPEPARDVMVKYRKKLHAMKPSPRIDNS